MFLIVEHTLSAALAASGTFTVNYPDDTDEDSFAGYGHVAISRDTGAKLNQPTDFTLAFNSASIEFTLGSGQTTIPAGSRLYLQLNLPGADADPGDSPSIGQTLVDVPGVSQLALVRVDLGSPLTLDADGIAEAQSPTGAGNLDLDGALASGGVVDLTDGAGGAPFGRNVIVDSGGADTAVLTITGTDWQGNAMSEALTLNGTTAVPGKKAFATITSIAHSATISNGAFVGTGDVLGMPFYIADDDEWVTELEDGVTATAGAFVDGVDSAATTTTGDVRGTYDPNSACDGAKHFVLYMAISDPTYQGVTQA